ncbi:MAG TPA: kelch repeat-containing protein [Acidimicrobiales bacterium]|nr:kelch repeat-containing protein [Acidimicrobiales bacterium]
MQLFTDDRSDLTARKTRLKCRLIRIVSLVSIIGTLIGVSFSNAKASTLNTWSPLASLATARTLAGAALLQNGSVLVVGGASTITTAGTPVSSAEIYNLATNVWSTTAAGAPSVSNAAVLALTNGEVLVAGGVSGSGTGASSTSSAETYNPTTNVWAPTANSMPTGVYGASAVPLANGTVMVAGGYTGLTSAPTATNAVSIYSPATDTWTTGDSLPVGDESAFGSAAILSNGNVIYAQGAQRSRSGQQRCRAL